MVYANESAQFCFIIRANNIIGYTLYDGLWDIKFRAMIIFRFPLVILLIDKNRFYML